jgi:hypothetical protein
VAPAVAGYGQHEGLKSSVGCVEPKAIPIIAGSSAP